MTLNHECSHLYNSLMETTEAGETVASHVMRISTAREIIQDLLDAIAAVSEERPSTRPS